MIGHRTDQPRLIAPAGQVPSPGDCETVGMKSGLTEAVRIAGVLSVVCAGWSVIPIRHPNVVSHWFNNEVSPWGGVWVVMLALSTIWMRRSFLLVLVKNVGEPLWGLAGFAAIFAIWAFPLPPRFGHYLYLIAFAAVLYGVGGAGWLRACIPALAILACLPGLPSAVHEAVVASLQVLGAVVATGFCKLFFSAEYVRVGTSVALPLSAEQSSTGGLIGLCVVVGPGCSGYRSLFGLLLVSLTCCAHPQLPVRGKVALLAAAVTMAIAINMLRIVVSTSFYHYGLEDFASGTAHSALGQALIVLEVVVLYLLWRQLLKKHPQRK